MRDNADPHRLLDWYDSHARVLPWRVSPQDRACGIWPNPYYVWLSEIMLQQTTVATVRSYFQKFIANWPTVHDLAAAPPDSVMAAWAGLGYYARARNLIKCAQNVVHDHDGIFPQDRDDLLNLPGIGPYTAAAIGSIAFDRREAVVDGNVIRVLSRIFAVDQPLPGGQKEITTLAASLTPAKRPGDYAQAIMDLGAVICTPKSPKCQDCPWVTSCSAHSMGRQTDFPKRAAKKPKPTRVGFAYIARSADGGWFLERRPQKGLLGGTLCWPCSDWGEDLHDKPPFPADWIETDLVVEHVFTHFKLHLHLRLAHIGEPPKTNSSQVVPATEFVAQDLPTVMRKSYDMAMLDPMFSAT